MDKNIKKEKEMAVSDYDYFLDDSKMPSAEESKRFTFPEEIEKKIDEDCERITKEFGLYGSVNTKPSIAKCGVFL